MSPSLKASIPAAASCTRASLLATSVHFEDGQECPLRPLYRPDLLHPLLALLLLLQQLALPGDVPAVELGGDILAQGLDRLASDHVRADRGLHGDVEELTGDGVLEALN